MRRRIFLCCLMVTLILSARTVSTAFAQDVVDISRSSSIWFDPVDAISSRIFAHAELVRAQGQMAVDVAYARQLQAKAVELELHNWKKFVEIYWDRKKIRQQKQLELNQLRQIKNQQYLNDRKATNRQLWDRIANHPELTAIAAIPKGTALNFLFERLSTTALVYEFVNEQRYGPEVFEQVRLDPEVVHALRLRQPAVGGAIEFRPDQAEPLDLEWWPYLLRGDKVAAERKRFKAARTEAAREADETGGRLSSVTLEKLDRDLAKLTQAFFARHPWSEIRERGYEKRTQYRTADAFLRSLMREVTRLQDTGDFRPLRTIGAYDPARDGDHLVGLLTYMTRNGLQFAPAAKGDEQAYHQVFRMMRDLYLVVSGNDVGTQPEDLTQGIKDPIGF